MCMPDDDGPGTPRRCYGGGYASCAGTTIQESGVEELHPGLLRQMAEHVNLGNEETCNFALNSIDAWR